MTKRSAESTRYPSWLYPISVLWGVLTGILLYAAARFPLWYIYWLGPSEDERGPFWDAGVLLTMALTGLLSVIYFRLVVTGRFRLGIRLVYTVAAALFPTIIITLSGVWWILDTGKRDVFVASFLWLAYGAPALLCLVPFGFLSGIVVQRFCTKRSHSTGHDNL